MNTELEYKLRDLLDVAIKYPISAVYETVTEKNRYSAILRDVITLRQSFELFRTQLLKSLSESENWKAIEIDLNNLYLIDIERYLKWYEDKKSETEIFGNYNPYEVLFDICTSTKREILKYFEGKETSNIKSPFTDTPTADLFEYIVKNWNYKYGQKWADIWNEINWSENYTPPYKSDYQTYIIERFGYTKKFAYEKLKVDRNRHKQRLLELIEEFSKK
jgi:hypothetical protein